MPLTVKLPVTVRSLLIEAAPIVTVGAVPRVPILIAVASSFTPISIAPVLSIATVPPVASISTPCVPASISIPPSVSLALRWIAFEPVPAEETITWFTPPPVADKVSVLSNLATVKLELLLASRLILPPLPFVAVAFILISPPFDALILIAVVSVLVELSVRSPVPVSTVNSLFCTLYTFP